VYRVLPDVGYLGVRIFFGISGFLICSRLIEESRVRGRIDLGGFYIRRFFRILPALFAMMLVVLLLSMCGVINVPLSPWLAGIFFAANYARGTGDWYVGHLWSLAVEEHFYLILPGLLALIGISRGLYASIFFAVTIALWRAFEFKFGLTSNSFDGAAFWGRTDLIADGLFWGCAIAFIHASTHRERLARLLNPTVWWMLFVFLFLSVPLKRYLPDWKLTMALYTLQAMIIPLAIVGTVMRSRNIIGRLFETSPLRWIGRLSYSIYLWQQLFLVDADDAYAAPWLQALQTFPISLLMIALLATLSYFLIELPMMRLGHRFAKPASAGRAELVEAKSPEKSEPKSLSDRAMPHTQPIR
ncbi:MAG TPA: acyltransferase, partial [Tepidisphaeraceae bacterium]|nr:acyltransferase [Tepidisphaeraceae bacterium]